MDKKSFLEEKYCELNKLKNMMQTYPKEYLSTIIKVMQSVCDEITNYLKKGVNNKGKKKNRVEERSFTKSELTKYNGANGNPIYVAVEGIVYDLSGIKTWIGGRHYGIAAGKDLTTYFMTCHKNQKDLLEKFEIVGRITD